jgi:probable addiction module antidote protein
MARKKTRSRAVSPQARQELAVAYLNAMLADAEPEELAAALGRIAQASGGPRLAEKVELSAQSLYRTLCRRGNPELRSTTVLLKAMGMRLVLQRIPVPPPPREAAIRGARQRRRAGYGTCVGSSAGTLQRDSHG